MDTRTASEALVNAIGDKLLAATRAAEERERRRDQMLENQFKNNEMVNIKMLEVLSNLHMQLENLSQRNAPPRTQYMNNHIPTVVDFSSPQQVSAMIHQNLNASSSQSNRSSASSQNHSVITYSSASYLHRDDEYADHYTPK